MKKILFLNAADSANEAEKLIATLKSKGFQVSTIANLPKHDTRGPALGAALSRFIEYHDQIFVLISDGLFANCSFKPPILECIKRRKCITIAPKNSQTILPSWFTTGFSGFRHPFK